MSATTGRRAATRPRGKKSSPSMSWPRRLAWAGGILAAGVVAIALAVFVPWTHWLGALRSQMEQMGAFGPALFAGVFILAELLLMPATPLTIFGAVAFGGWAFPIVFCAAMSAAALAFTTSRYLFRDRVKGWIKGSPKLHALDKVTQEGGWKTIVLVTMSPLLPFAIQNYVMGATKVRFREYLIGTAVGILPSTAMCVYIGAAGKHIRGDHSAMQWTMLGAGLVATVALTWWLGRRAKRQLEGK